jgi:small subunit ribosomal protein S6
MALINPEVTDEALTTEVDYVSGLITSFGGEITLVKRDTPWGRRRLAYPIQRFRDATYVLIQFMATPSIISPIERDLKLDARIIRYLLVRNEPSPEPESESESEPGASAEAASEAGPEQAAQPDETPETEVAEPASTDNEVENE